MKSRKNPRLKDWDYRRVGGYFLTICTKDKIRYFGEVKEREMKLNSIGKQIEKCRHEIPQHHPYVELDAYICMPNHIHGIIFITKSVGTKYFSSDKRVNNNSSLQTGAVSGSLGSIVRGFKIGITKRCNQNNTPFQRQTSYYDHIIRNEKDLHRIREYIEMNPYKRENDEFYTS